MSRVGVMFLLKLFLFVFTLLRGVSVYAVDYVEERYVFDVGSSTIKVKGYKVDLFENKVIEVLPGYSKKVSHKSCMLSSSDGATLTSNCIKNTVDAMLQLQSLYNINCFTNKCAGFATAWARDASNIEEVLDAFKREAGVNITVISQAVEGNFAFEAVAMKLRQENRNLSKNDLIFDIGGGSFQLVGHDNNSRFVFEGMHGTESIASKLSKLFQKNNRSYISCRDLDKVYKYLDEEIGQAMAEHVNLNQFIDKQGGKIYGVSLFLRNGLRRDIGIASNSVNREDLRSLNNEICNMNYKNLERSFPKVADSGYTMTVQAGIVLLDSIMKNLYVNKIEIVDADLQDYFVVRTDFWRQQRFDYNDLYKTQHAALKRDDFVNGMER